MDMHDCLDMCAETLEMRGYMVTLLSRRVNEVNDLTVVVGIVKFIFVIIVFNFIFLTKMIKLNIV